MLLTVDGDGDERTGTKDRGQGEVETTNHKAQTGY